MQFCFCDFNRFFGDDHGVVFAVGFGAFGASGVRHIHFLDFQSFPFGEIFKILAPFAGVFEIAFIDFAQKFSRQNNILRVRDGFVRGNIQIHAYVDCLDCSTFD
jgi:hypothetical protein